MEAGTIFVNLRANAIPPIRAAEQRLAVYTIPMGGLNHVMIDRL